MVCGKSNQSSIQGASVPYLSDMSDKQQLCSDLSGRTDRWIVTDNTLLHNNIRVIELYSWRR